MATVADRDCRSRTVEGPSGGFPHRDQPKDDGDRHPRGARESGRQSPDFSLEFHAQVHDDFNEQRRGDGRHDRGGDLREVPQGVVPAVHVPQRLGDRALCAKPLDGVTDRIRGATRLFEVCPQFATKIVAPRPTRDSGPRDDSLDQCSDRVFVTHARHREWRASRRRCSPTVSASTRRAVGPWRSVRNTCARDRWDRLARSP